MHRFFLTGQSLAVAASVDLSAIGHQLSRVLRLGAGDRVVLLDGEGDEYVAELTVLGGETAVGRVESVRPARGEPVARLALYQCALKADKMEWVLQKGTELGVSRFVPVISERTIVRPAARLVRKYDRWRAIIREAAEQSGRGRLPDLAQPVSWSEAVSEGDGACMLRLAPWEAAEDGTGLAQTVRYFGAQRETEVRGGLRVALVIGPEGGISGVEMEQARAKGWRPVTMGPRVLRAETAALAAVTTVMSVLGEMA